jgi:hypothetical protein
MVAGRPSAAGRSGMMLPGERLAPPDGLTAEEQDEWTRLVEPLPPGFVTAEHTTMLRELVRCTMFARRLAEKIEAMLETAAAVPAQDSTWGTMQELMKSHGTMVEKIIKLSRALRITKQARYDAVVSKTKRQTAAPIKPWNDWQTERGAN